MPPALDLLGCGRDSLRRVTQPAEQIVERWRSACFEMGMSDLLSWPSAEATTLVERLLSGTVNDAGATVSASVTHTRAGRDEEHAGTESGGGSTRAEHARWRALTDAARAWAQHLASLAIMNRQVSALRRLMGEIGLDPARATNLTEELDVVLLVAGEELSAQLEGAAMRDPLTGAGNRRWLEVAADAILNRSAQSGEPVCLIGIDLDGLKRVNDFQGHRAGDEVIISLVAGLTAAARGSDQVFRTGGDEFVVLLPGSTKAGALEYLGRLSDFPTPRFTWGAADTSEGHRTLGHLFEAADRRLYEKRHDLSQGAPAHRLTGRVSAQVPAGHPASEVGWWRWRGVVAKARAVELAVSGALVLAIGSVMTSLSSGNHQSCSLNQGPGVADCGVSNAIYYIGIVLIVVGALALAGGLTMRLLLGRRRQ